MAEMGRPKKEIDKTQFKKLCSIQCTKEELCSFFDVSDSTLSRWCKSNYEMTFEEVHKKYASVGKMSLRRYQWKLAEKSVPMAIFLGKQYLGQKDVIENVDDTQMKKVEELLAKIKDEANDNK